MAFAFGLLSLTGSKTYVMKLYIILVMHGSVIGEMGPLSSGVVECYHRVHSLKQSQKRWAKETSMKVKWPTMMCVYKREELIFTSGGGQQKGQPPQR